MSEYNPTTFISSPTRYLSQREMRMNARIIIRFFRAAGWTDNAIAGMLGNMETESTLNPGLWQGRTIPPDPLTAEKGFGLTQWDPARKLINWCNEFEPPWDYTSGQVQMMRIIYEAANNLQWTTDNILGYNWSQFINSTESPEILARVFCWAYEIPEDPDMEKRQNDARKWFNFMHSWAFEHPPWLLFKFNERRRTPSTSRFFTIIRT